MTPRHDVDTHPDGIPAQSWSPTESLPLPAPKRKWADWEWSVLYVSPWLIGAGTAIWLAYRTGSRVFLIVASLLSLALLIALFVTYHEHLEAKK